MDLYTNTQVEYKTRLKLMTIYKLVISQALTFAIESITPLFDSDVWKEHFSNSAGANWDIFFYQEMDTFRTKIEFLCHCMRRLVNGSEYSASSKDYLITLREGCLPSGCFLTKLTNWMEDLKTHGNVMRWMKMNEDKVTWN
jgi:hypothetical protein